MGRKSTTGGVIARGDRIQFDFTVGKRRYRPTVDRLPTEANLRRERKRATDIARRIQSGTFSLAEEFPDYKFLGAVKDSRPTFNKVADAFMAAMKSDLEFATIDGYRKILKSFWRPKFGERAFLDLTYGQDLAPAIGDHPWGSRKTRNNVVSAGKLVFDYGYADHPNRNNPATRLKSVRIQRPTPDPYTIAEAETLIAGILKDWGAHDANYFEFAFFAGPRPSEEIALLWSDYDTPSGRIRIERARVMGKDKDSTKTHDSRDTELSPRAVDVLRRQRALTGLAGGPIFTREDGKPYHDLQVQWKRWRFTHKRLGIRYREPYQTRHSSVSWNLMMGKNILWVAQQHGHSAAVMLKTYAKWLTGTTDADVEAIKRAFGFGTDLALKRAK